MSLIEKIDKFIKEITKLASHPTYGIFIYLAVCFIGLLIIMLILSSFGPVTTKKLEVPSFGELLAKKVKPTSNITTVEDIMCYFLHQNNLTNITLGNIVCFPWNNECICISPLK